MNPINLMLEMAGYYSREILVEQLEEAVKNFKIIPTEDSWRAVTKSATLINMKEAIENMGIDKVRAAVREKDPTKTTFDISMN